jgi:hypothetical protein
LCMQ